MCISYADVRLWNRIYSKWTISKFPCLFIYFLFIVRGIFKIRYSYRCDFLTAYGLYLKISEPQFASLQSDVCAVEIRVSFLSSEMSRAIQVQRRDCRCHLLPSNKLTALCLYSLFISSQNSSENVALRFAFISRNIQINLQIFLVPKITHHDR